MAEKELDKLMTWLNNAYSMEIANVEILKAYAEDAEEAGFAEINEKISDHVKETESQAERVKNEIERLGGKVSTMKEWGGKMMGAIQGVMTELHADQAVKNLIADHATEHFEMAVYKAISEAAGIIGEEETKSLAEEIMQEEIAMAKKTEEALPMVVEHYIKSEE